MRRDAQAVLLLALAAGLGKLALTGTATRYVGAGMVPLLLLAATVMTALGAFALLRSLLEAREQRRRPATGAAGAVGAGAVGAGAAGTAGATGAAAGVDEPGRARLGWLLLAPIAIALVVVPPPLGADQAGRYGTELQRHAPAEFGPVAEGDPVRLSLVEYAGRAVLERGQSLSGRRVSLVGFVVAAVDGRPYLARLVVSCCAADARPVKVGLIGSVPAGLREGAWIEVEGGYTDQLERDPLTGDLIPYLEVSNVRPIEVPARPYEAG